MLHIHRNFTDGHQGLEATNHTCPTHFRPVSCHLFACFDCFNVCVFFILCYLFALMTGSIKLVTRRSEPRSRNENSFE